ncbi:hypothetical protein [Streptomyces sp. NPDC051567]|uniref:hypothetical protein n=1 Tax=Streptomyces sp. NPDC051567 TaxID=3365660 RepID=UPI00378AEA7A
MRPSLRAPLLLSQLPPDHIALTGERRSLRCPDCDQWQPIRRGMVQPHRSPRPRQPKPHPGLPRVTTGPIAHVPRCPGSGRPVTIDLTVAEWQAQLPTVSIPDAPVIDSPDAVSPDARRATRVKRSHHQPVTPLHRMRQTPAR